MKKILLVFLSILTLFILGLIAAPIFVNLNHYKPEIIAKVESLTGVTPNIQGDIGILLFPIPAITMENVAIANIDGGSKSDMITIPRVEVNSSYIGLLKGQIEIKTIRIVNPVIELERLANGKKNWQAFLNKKTGNKQAEKLPHTIEIKNGYIGYQSQTIRQKIDYVNAVITMDSAHGPFAIKGQFDSHDTIIKIEGFTGNVTKETEAELHIGSDTFIWDFKGKSVVKEDGKWSIEGQTHGKIPVTADFINAYFMQNALLSSLQSKEAIELKSSFAVNAETLKLPDMVVSSNSIKGKGAIDILVGGAGEGGISWDIDIGFEKINFDGLIAKPAKTQENEEDKAQVNYFANSLKRTGLADYQLDIPDELAILLNFKIDKIIYRAQEVNQFSIDMDVFDGKALIHHLGAKLPGNSSAEFTGIMTHNGIRPQLTGSFKASGTKFRDIFIWVYPNMAFLPEEQFNEFLFNADIAMTPQKIEMNEIYALADRILLTGNVNILPRSKIPVFHADLKLDRLNFDQYQMTRKVDDWFKDLFNHLTPEELGKSWLRELNISGSVNLNATDLTYNDHEMSNVSAILAVSPGILDLQRFVVTGNKAGFVSRVKLNLLTARPQIDVSMRSSGIDTSAFLLPVRNIEKKMSPASGFQRSKEPLNLQKFGLFDGVIDIESAVLKHEDVLLTNLKLKGSLDKHVLSFKDVSAKLGKGQISGDISLALTDNPNLAASFKLANLQIKEFVDAVHFPSQLEGLMNVAGILRTSGNSLYEWIKNASSKLDFRAANVIVQQFDIHSIIVGTAQSYSVIDMKKIVDQAFKEGVTIIKNLQGQAIIEKGMAKIENVRFTGAYSAGIMASNINLYNFNSHNIFRFAFSPRPNDRVNFTVTFTGPVTELKRTIDTTAIDNYITNKAGSR